MRVRGSEVGGNTIPQPANPYLCHAGNNSDESPPALIGPDTKTVVFEIGTPDYKIIGFFVTGREPDNSSGA